VEFIGIDLSEPMLERARDHVIAQNLTNVELRLCSITDLHPFAGSSVDAVMSTLSLHHLPSVDDLRRVFSEVARVLRPDGGVYLTDFGHLRSERSIRYFANQYADRQPELFTLDYLNSLRAAFAVGEIESAAAALGRRARLYATFMAPYMVVVKSKIRRTGDGPAKQLEKMRAAMPAHHQVDFRDLKTFFALGGLRTRLVG